MITSHNVTSFSPSKLCMHSLFPQSCPNAQPNRQHYFHYQNQNTVPHDLTAHETCWRLSKQNRQCTCNIILRRVHETTVAVESNQYYMYLRVRTRARVHVVDSMRMHARVCVVGGCWGWVHERGRVLAYLSSRPRASAIFSASSDSTIFFDIITQTARFSESHWP
jgi:hypothetical protein